MKRTLLLGFVLILLFVLGGASVSSATPSVDPSCDPADQAHITAVLDSDGSHATFTVQNTLPLCDPVGIGHAVYVKNADGLVFPQELVDSSTDTITSGSKTLSVTIPQNGTSPMCFTQIDAVVGPIIQEITEDNRYNDRVLAWQYGTIPKCAEVEAESTSTSSSTTTTSTTSTSTTTTSTTATTTTIEGQGNTNNLPPSVLGEEITKQSPAAVAPAAVAPQQLARTGASRSDGVLVSIAGLLLVVGGLAIALVNQPRRRAS